MIVASREGHTDIAKLLINKGADVNAKTSDGKTALMWASEKGHTDIIAILDPALGKKLKHEKLIAERVKAQKELNARLISAMQNGHVDPDEVKRLLDQGTADDTVFLTAVQHGFIDIVRILIGKGANPNAHTWYRTPFLVAGHTALMLASEKGHTEIAKLLIDKGADINAEVKFDGMFRTRTGTALMLASKEGHTEIVKLLIAKGVKPDAAALILASANGHAEIAKLLIDKGAYVHARDRNGGTVLMRAAEHGHLEMVKLLVKAGAEVNATTTAGFGPAATALSLAEINGHVESAKYLRSKGAK